MTPEQIAIAEEIEAAEESGEVDVLVVESEGAPEATESTGDGDTPKKRRRRRGGRGRGGSGGGESVETTVVAE